MKSKILSAILSIAMVIASTTNVVFADATVLTDGGELSAGDYILNEDITLTSNITINGTVSIDLNGHVLTGNGSGSVITVSSGKLTLTDNSQSMTGKVTGGNAINGGGVYVSGGSFEMTGGTITGNEAGHGGGIFVASGAQTIITNGIIENNHTTASGAGVQVDGNFTMTGGTTKNNKADGDGGGLSINGDTGMATLAGTTEIINNTANGKGGGVSYYNASDKVILGGSVRITGNVVGGTINDGTLTGGTANNVYLFYDNLYVAIGTGIYAPADGMLVGITTHTPPAGTPVKFTTNGTADDVKYFTSDNANYKIQHNNTSGYLELANITIVDILETVPDGFPTDSQSGWVIKDEDKSYRAYKNVDEAKLIVGGDKVSLNTVLTKDGNDYKYVKVSGLHEYTFYMESDVLKSISIIVIGDTTGEYIPYKYVKYPTESKPQSYTGNLEFITNGKFTNINDVVVTVDDTSLTLNTDYTVGHGSVKVILLGDYLKKLGPKTYTISIGVIDSTNGNVLYKPITSLFTITPIPTPTPTSDPTPSYKVPNTGVEGTANSNSLLKLSSLSLLAIGTYVFIKKKKDN